MSGTRIMWSPVLHGPGLVRPGERPGDHHPPPYRGPQPLVGVAGGPPVDATAHLHALAEDRPRPEDRRRTPRARGTVPRPDPLIPALTLPRVLVVTRMDSEQGLWRRYV